MENLKQPKPKKCKVCGDKFTPIRSIQPCCEKYECKVAYAIKAAEKSAVARKKKESRQYRERKVKLKTRSDYIKEAQIVFNRYIRARDYGFNCISCNSVIVQSSVVGGGGDCGHYRSVGSSPHLRFNEWNANSQCKKCNRYLSGNVTNYRIGLIRKCGIQKVEELESDNTPAKWTIDDLIAIKQKYSQMTKELIKSRENS